MAAAAGANRTVLGGKEKESFKTLVDCYEKKKYEKGIKTADIILKKYSTHGETLSMKGLIMNSMGKKEEAYELVKQGLRYDVKSHICWHVYGLLHRSDSNYQEASKCYLNALKIDVDNQNILRDLSWLQVQMRDMTGFVETRETILKFNKNRNSWVALAVANFANEKYQVAYDTIEEYNKISRDKAEAYEESELLLFQNKCLEKLGRFTEGIEHLTKHKKQVKDVLAWKTKLAELLVLSGNFEGAKTKWKNLIAEQPDNYRFHCGLQATHLELDDKQSAAMFSLKRLDLPSTTLPLDRTQLVSLRELYKECSFKSKYIRNIMLTFYRVSSSGDADFNEEDNQAFTTLLDEHMKFNLRKGMPALYHDVCSLIRLPDLSNPGQTTLPKEPFDFIQHPITIIASRLVDGYIHNLRETETFDKDAGAGDGNDQQKSKEAPPALLWALYLKCHLLELSGNLQGAMAVIDQSIDHTPTALDMYCKKAKLMKNMGDFYNASTVMDDCRLLDLQDRYLNNKTTKYLLRADEMKRAMATISMFTKHEGDSQKILYELQCNWYEIEAAESYARTKQWGLALKKFNAVKKHFNDYYDEMFDFHGYCVRKTTLRAYWDVLTMQDDGFTHKFYQRATRGALELFIHLLDCPEDIDGLGHLPAAERKKKRDKLKKQRKKEEEAERLRVEEEKRFGTSKDAKNLGKSDKDEDPNGDKLLAKGDFLNEALQYCKALNSRLHMCQSETLALMAEIHVRSLDYQQALRELRTGLKNDAHSPALSCMLVKVAIRARAPVNKKQPALDAGVVTEIGMELMEAKREGEEADSAITASQLGPLLDAYIVRYTEKAKAMKSLPHVIAASKCVVLNGGVVVPPSAAATTPPAQPAAVVEKVTKALDVALSGRGVSLVNVTVALEFLQSTFGLAANVTTTFHAAALEKFPLHFALLANPRTEGKELEKNGGS